MLIILLVIIIFSRYEKIKALEVDMRLLLPWFRRKGQGCRSITVCPLQYCGDLRLKRRKNFDPLPPPKSFARFHPIFRVIGGLLFHFILFKIVAQIKKSETHFCLIKISFSWLRIILLENEILSASFSDFCGLLRMLLFLFCFVCYFQHLPNLHYFLGL